MVNIDYHIIFEQTQYLLLTKFIPSSNNILFSMGLWQKKRNFRNYYDRKTGSSIIWNK